jgi:hypothetical protein
MVVRVILYVFRLEISDAREEGYIEDLIHGQDMLMNIQDRNLAATAGCSPIHG